MKIIRSKEYQTVRLFATLGVLTLIAVLLFRVVLFEPASVDKIRQPAEVTVIVSETLGNK